MQVLFKITLFVLSLTLWTPPLVTAGPYEDGLATYEMGNYRVAQQLWRPIAEQGYADTQYYLGFM